MAAKLKTLGEDVVSQIGYGNVFPRIDMLHVLVGQFEPVLEHLGASITVTPDHPIFP